MDAITKLEQHMNDQAQHIADAFSGADLETLFRDGATAEEVNTRCALVDRACYVLADARNRADLPDDIRRAAAIVYAAGFVR